MARDVQDLPGLIVKVKKKLPGIMLEGMLEAADHAANIIREVVFASVTGSRTTGALARSFKPELVETKKGEVTAQAVSRLSYARIQDQGGVIRPKSVKNLAIPFPGTNPPVGRWPRHESGLQFIKSKRGNKLLVRMKGNGKFEPRWILKPRVRIKPKHYMIDATIKAAPGVKQIMGKHFKALGRL